MCQGPPLLVTTAQDFRPVDIVGEGELDRLFRELRAVLLAGQRLTVSVRSSSAPPRKPVLVCSDCGVAGHLTRRYGGCKARSTGHRQERPSPPRRDHGRGDDSHLPTPPSSQSAGSGSASARTPGLALTTPVPPRSARTPAPRGSADRSSRPLACSTAARLQTSTIEERSVAAFNLPSESSDSEFSSGPSGAEGGLLDLSFQDGYSNDQGRWSPSWELQPLSPRSLRRARNLAPWLWDDELSTEPDLTEFTDDELRLLWGAAFTRGAEPIIADYKADLWAEESRRHDVWERQQRAAALDIKHDCKPSE